MKRIWSIIFALILISLFQISSATTPFPKGRVYEISAKVLSLDRIAYRDFYPKENLTAVFIEASIEILEVNSLIMESESPGTTKHLDTYRVGQVLKVSIQARENSLHEGRFDMETNTVIKCNIHASGKNYFIEQINKMALSRE
ncbi:MAG: hypothetical protein PHT50_06440 [Candidatus Omnitrophica bacterium]|nr:hypothetical protein [Candidatus Omnitrophota bacterium]